MSRAGVQERVQCWLWHTFEVNPVDNVAGPRVAVDEAVVAIEGSHLGSEVVARWRRGLNQRRSQLHDVLQTILQYILISIMGCCESRLVDVQPLDSIYEQQPIHSNPHYQPEKKDLLPVGTYHNSRTTSHDGCSIDSLQSQLEEAINEFENKRGTITYTFLQKIHKNTYREANVSKKESSRMQVPSTNPTNHFETNQENFTQFNLNESHSSGLSNFRQNNSRLLSNASLRTKRELQKDLFYINSDEILGIKLMKWTENQRMAVNFTQEQLLKGVQNTDCFQFASSVLQLHSYESKSKLKLLAAKELGDAVGFRVYINGIKRMLKLTSCEGKNFAVSILEETPKILAHLKNMDISIWIYVLSGWIPETINLSPFSETNQIFRRLINNYLNGNILIGFSNAKKQFLLIKQVGIESKTVKAVKMIQNGTSNTLKEQQTFTWAVLAKNYPLLNVNWNPLIYNFQKKVESTSKSYLKSDGSMGFEKLQFLIEMPPSTSQIQIRLLAQIHCTNFQNINKTLTLSLYEFNGGFVENKVMTPIREVKSSNRLFLSEIFIFEKSTQQSQYLLKFSIDKNCDADEQIQITVDTFSFCQINVRNYFQPKLLKNVEFYSQITTFNAGFGMNSPFFDKNLQYSLSISKGSLCRINIQAETQKPLLFQICALADNRNNKDITLIRPQQIVKSIIQSEQFQNNGCLQFKAKSENYIVILVCYTPTNGKVKISVDEYSNPVSITLPNKNVLIQEIKNEPVFIKEFEFDWKNSDSGPRKRTKTNSEPICYPIQTFSKFFQNPFIDYFLQEGVYQFSVVSKTFNFSFPQQYLLEEMNQFESTNEEINKILNASPPSLSLGVFRLTKAKKQATIVLDDYEYVPYGIGYWTSPTKFSGLHRFVMPKMEKGEEKGILRIRKL